MIAGFIWTDDMREVLKLYQANLADPKDWWKRQFHAWDFDIIRRRCIELRGQEFWDDITSSNAQP